MHAYVATTGVVFFLIVLAHAARIVAEGARILLNPLFAVTTLLAIGLCLWAGLLWNGSRQG